MEYTEKQIEAAEFIKKSSGKYPHWYTPPKSAQKRLIELESQRKLDAIERVDSPGGSTKIDSVMAGYPVSVLSKQNDKEINSKKDELSALKVQHELEAFQRVLSKEGGSRTDSVTVGYPVSSLSKRIAAPEDISDANIESLLSYYRNAPLETGQDDVVMQAVTDELIRRFGTSQNTTKDNTKAVLKPKTKAKTKDKKPVKLPFLWKNQLNNARRAVENDKSEKTTIKSYLNERKWSNEQIIAATIRDQTGN